MLFLINLAGNFSGIAQFPKSIADDTQRRKNLSYHDGVRESRGIVSDRRLSASHNSIRLYPFVMGIVTDPRLSASHNQVVERRTALVL
jgi:hypothetical protein